MFRGSHVPLAVVLSLVLLIPTLGVPSISAAPAPAPAAAQQSPHLVEVIVGFANQERAVQAVENAGGNVVLSYTIVPAFMATVPENTVTALERNPNVRYVHENGVVEAVAQTVPWGIERVNAPSVWTTDAVTGASVNVAILDTGVGPHRDLSVKGGTNTISTSSSSFADDNGHGTHVAGSMAALDNSIDVVGVAFDANIYSVKVLDANGSGSINSILLGIQWSVDNDMDIISMSLGTKSHFEALKEAVDNSFAAGLLNVAAAGNEGNPPGNGNNIIYPARYDSVIAVGAIREDNLRASFSSTGPTLEIMAPGQRVLSTYLNDSLRELSGTSMAAPHVSGAAALVWSANPELTNSQVRQILRDTAIPLGDPNRYGHGLADAKEAVTAALGGVVAPEEPEEPSSPPPISVTIVNPSNGSTLQNTVTIQAAVDSADSIDSVEYTIINADTLVVAADNMNFNSDAGYWETTWNTESVADGEYTITVQSADVNEETASESVTVTVANNVPEPQELVVSITSDKESYALGDRVYIQVQVTDGASAVSGASMSIEIITASGRTYTGSGTTDGNGETTFNLKTKNPDGRGTYTVNTTASKAGYDSGSNSMTFNVS